MLIKVPFALHASSSFAKATADRRFTNKGFTLLEVIVAITILAAMMLSITQISTGISTARNKSTERNDKQHSVILVLTKFSDDLRTAFQADNKFWGKDNSYKTGFVGDATLLNFSTMSNVHRIENHRDTSQVQVGYSLEQAEDGNYNLMRRGTDYLVEDLDTGGKTYVLLSGLKELTFEYYDAKQSEWVESWDTGSITSMGRLPQMVKIKMVLAAVGKKEEDEDETLAARKRSFELVIPIEMYDKKIGF